MRSNGICIWLLLNIMLMGMMGYMYLLWVQYWRYVKKNAIMKQENYPDDNKLFHFEEEVGIQVREGRPRIRFQSDSNDDEGFAFPMYDAEADVNEAQRAIVPTTAPPPVTMSAEEQIKAAEKQKAHITVLLRSSQKSKQKEVVNRYNVKYRGPREKGVPTKEQIMCGLQRTQVRTLRDGDEPFTSEGMAKYFPHEGLMEGRYYNNCAVITSAASIIASNLGEFIDSHDAVIRFNDAPIHGYERDVGSKTTLRIINSQIPTKPKFDFWGSSLYRNVSLLVWDPSDYTASLAEWYASPDFPVFPEYFRRRLMLPYESLHLLHPASMWNIWNTLQMFSSVDIFPNPPSSGFLGIILMLRHCKWVNVVEFLPSIRYSKHCHYWDPKSDDSGCTISDWHPLSNEKLMIMQLNAADDVNTFVKGYATLPGFSQFSSCSSDNPR